jgi:signal transduction histidine kinase
VKAGPKSLSLLWKILLSTSIAITVLLGLTGWFVQDQMLRAMSQNVEREMEVSAKAYQSLWRARAAMLSSVSLVLSSMSDVRAAFSTRDQATIRDTAGEKWAKISENAGVFLVTGPQGDVMASLGGAPGDVQDLGLDVPAVRQAARNFPEQTSGFVMQNSRLYEMVITPVYVEASQGLGLLNVLVTGFPVSAETAKQLKRDTGQSDFLFLAGGRVIASTLQPNLSADLARQSASVEGFRRVHASQEDYGVIRINLRNVEGQPIGALLIARSFASVQESLAALQRDLVLTWLGAILLCLAVSYWLARRILEPVKQLDRAATEIARQNYAVRLPLTGADELGRLASTFNTMCQSIQEARAELITRERIQTIGQLSSSIVHDLRNPLAAIYGGSELLMDADWNPAQTQRLATNIYRSSRMIKDMLQELVDVSRGRTQPAEICQLREVIAAAADACSAAADTNSVAIQQTVCDDLELPLERARMERVFLNLIGNAIEAMPGGGTLAIGAEMRDGSVWVRVEDSGPGVPATIREVLFQPFTTSGKKNGLGLGLALSRESVQAHGGELWLDRDFVTGTRFCLRLPMA